jgi:transcription factor SPN1
MSDVSDSPPTTPLPDDQDDKPDRDRPLSEERDGSPEMSNNDDDSDLSEVDEAEFENFDPTTIALTQEPVAIDETNVNLLVAHKRKRADADKDSDFVDGEGGRKKKKKEGKRDKPKKKKRRDDDDDVGGGLEIEGKRERKKKADGERKERPKARKSSPEPQNEEHLSPEERKCCTVSRTAIIDLHFAQVVDVLWIGRWMRLFGTRISAAKRRTEL